MLLFDTKTFQTRGNHLTERSVNVVVSGWSKHQPLSSQLIGFACSVLSVCAEGNISQPTRHLSGITDCHEEDYNHIQKSHLTAKIPPCSVQQFSHCWLEVLIQGASCSRVHLRVASLSLSLSALYWPWLLVAWKQHGASVVVRAEGRKK
jgi:hypothetical protein